MSFDSRTLSRRSAALALVAAPVLFLVSGIVEPAWSDDAGAYLDEVAGDTTGHLAWSGLFALGALALSAGLLGAARLLRGPRGALGQVGATTVAFSAAVLSGLLLAIGVTEVAMVDPAADRAEMAALYDRTEDVTLAMVVFGLVWFGGLVLGTLALAVGLVLRRVVPLWSPLLFVAWLATMFFVDDRVGSIVGSFLLLGALAPLAHRIASMTDEQWARWQPVEDGPRSRAVSSELRTSTG